MESLGDAHVVANQLFTEFESVSWRTPLTRAVETLGCAFGTHPGLRRARNEDRLVLAQIDRPNGELLTIAAVCDGVGGSEMGDAAATVGLVSLVERASRLTKPLPLSELLVLLVRGMDDDIRFALDGRGTTTTCIWICSSEGAAAAVSVGDSRIFSWRPGKGVRQLSEDDTLENELRGLRVKDPSVLDVKGLRGSLSQALGQPGRTSSELQLNVIEGSSLDEGVILATDGVWRSNESGFGLIAKHADSPQDLVKRSLTFANWCGGLDNASIIAIRAGRASFGPSYHRAAADLPYTIVTTWLGDSKIVIRVLGGVLKRASNARGASRKDKKNPPLKERPAREAVPVSYMRGPK